MYEILSTLKKKLVFFVISLLFSLLSVLLAMYVVNRLIPHFCQDCNPGFISIAVENAKFDSRYVFWENPNCIENCENYLDSIATSEIMQFGIQTGDCRRVLFLGDSFTDSPWDGKGKSYAEHFVSNLAINEGSCYELLRLAASGSGTDQQFAKFFDVVGQIKPDMVVWQFYYNDMYDNIYKPLFEESQTGFMRIRAWSNAYFWSGWLYQNISILQHSQLGAFLLYMGELKKDLKLDWYAIETDESQVLIDFNEIKLTYLIGEMKKLEKQYGFQFVTTLSPLECEFISPQNCHDPIEGISFANEEFIQHQLERILQENSNFISMYKNDSLSAEDSLNANDFWYEEKQVGARHLGATGQEKVGKILFINYLNREHVQKN